MIKGSFSFSIVLGLMFFCAVQVHAIRRPRRNRFARAAEIRPKRLAKGDLPPVPQPKQLSPYEQAIAGLPKRLQRCPDYRGSLAFQKFLTLYSLDLITEALAGGPEGAVVCVVCLNPLLNNDDGQVPSFFDPVRVPNLDGLVLPFLCYTQENVAGDAIKEIACCRHALHRKCFAQYVEAAKRYGRTKACPTCRCEEREWPISY